MAGYILGDTVVQEWTVYDATNVPITGVTSPAGIDLVLLRQSGALMIAATEAVVWTEIGVTGRYSISFVPLSLGFYILELEELHASSTKRIHRFEVEVLAAGAIFSPAFTNAFCAESDMERWLGQLISATTSPTATEAAGFAEERAAVLMSLCAKW